jgi:CheY-like chemotaxis protein
MARLTVQDNGQGISPSFLPHVFERFRQADGSTSRKHGGLGLGLAIVQHLVHLHGGTVRAESEGVGRGATFVVDIPLMQKPTSQAPPRADARRLSRAERPLSGVRVLVVDDEVDSIGVVITILEQAGAIVTAAESAAEALEKMSAVPPDVVVSDIGMPQADGYDLIRTMREQSHLQGIPALALTAYARPQDRARALDAGYQEHQAKPIVARELLANVRRLAKK